MQARHKLLRYPLIPASVVFVGALAIAPAAMAVEISSFTAGDLIISTVSSFNGGGLDTASPIVLQQFQLSANGAVATSSGTFTLPQIGSGNNSAISGEFGSASEGILQRSVDGK